jgi:hypothetical protein
VSSWRDELIEAVKGKAERDAEEEERRRKRIEEALRVAEEALGKARDALEFARGQLESKKQPATLGGNGDRRRLVLGPLSLAIELSREDAVIKVTYNEGRPREFDFAKDRHLSPQDIEEYVGRRAVELTRAAQKAQPW